MRFLFFSALAIFTGTQIIGCSGGSSSSTTTSGLSIDAVIVEAEVTCIRQYAANSLNNYVSYAVEIGAPKVTDNIHSGLQPCATFMVSGTGNNQIALYKSSIQYPGGIKIVVQGSLDELPRIKKVIF